MSKPIQINGATGPYTKGRPGDYGRNAIHNYMDLLKPGTKKARNDYSNATLRYTPEGTVYTNDMFNNLFGLAEEDIKPYDTNGNGTLDFAEFQAMNQTIKRSPISNWLLKHLERKLFSAMDIDGDGQIDVVEDAAATLVQDMSSKQEYVNYRTLLGQKVSGFFAIGKPTGEITSRKRAQFYSNAMKSSWAKVIKMQIASIIARYDLEGRYEQFKASSTQSTAPEAEK